jgi:hypothetical protein
MKLIRTKYLPITTYKGSRVVADDGDGNRIIVGWGDALNVNEVKKRAAYELCKKMKWDATNLLYVGEWQKYMFFTIDKYYVGW